GSLPACDRCGIHRWSRDELVLPPDNACPTPCETCRRESAACHRVQYPGGRSPQSGHSWRISHALQVGQKRPGCSDIILETAAGDYAKTDSFAEPVASLPWRSRVPLAGTLTMRMLINRAA